MNQNLTTQSQGGNMPAQQTVTDGIFTQGGFTAFEDSDYVGLPFLTLKQGDKAIVRFFTHVPQSFYRHEFVKDPNTDKNLNVTCIRNQCPACIAGHEARHKYAYLVLHLNSSGNEGQVVPQLKVYMAPISVVKSIGMKQQINTQNPISSRNLVILREGSGLKTTRYYVEEHGSTELPDFDVDKFLKFAFSQNMNISTAQDVINLLMQNPSQTSFEIVKEQFAPDMERLQRVAEITSGMTTQSNVVEGEYTAYEPQQQQPPMQQQPMQQQPTQQQPTQQPMQQPSGVVNDNDVPF